MGESVWLKQPIIVSICSTLFKINKFVMFMTCGSSHKSSEGDFKDSWQYSTMRD